MLAAPDTHVHSTTGQMQANASSLPISQMDVSGGLVKATVATQADEATVTPTSVSPHITLDWDVTYMANHATDVDLGDVLTCQDSTPSITSCGANNLDAPPSSCRSSPSEPTMCRFVPMETVLDDTCRKMYSIVSSHLAHCKSSLESDPHTTTLQRRLDRANQRIHELEVDNGRLVDALATADVLSKTIAEENASLRQTLDASRLDGLLHQANVQHVESLRHELTALQEQQNLPIHPSQPPSKVHENQNPGSMWPPEIHNKLAHVDRLLYLLQSATSSSRTKTLPSETRSLPQSENTLAHGHPSWQQHYPPQYDVGHAMEARIHQLFQDMHMASQQVIEFQTTMSDQALNQLLDVETVLRRELDTLRAGTPTQVPSKATATSLPIERFRKCTVPDCPKGVRSRGLCKGHGGGKRCEVRGCVKSNQGGGFCIAHGGGRRCAVDGCKSAAQIQGTCKAHRQTSAATRQSKSRSTSPCQQQAGDARAGHDVQAGEDRRRVMHHNDDGHATST